MLALIRTPANKNPKQFVCVGVEQIDSFHLWQHIWLRVPIFSWRNRLLPKQKTCFASSARVFMCLSRAQDIPEQERWECRKNALTAEMRHYLDTGLVSPPRPEKASCKSVEIRQGQTRGEQRNQDGDTTTTTRCSKGVKGDQRRDCPEGGVKSCAGGNTKVETEITPSPPPEDAALFIAGIFGGEDDRGMEDY